MAASEKIDRGMEYHMNEVSKKGYIPFLSAFKTSIKGYAHKPKRLLLVSLDKSKAEAYEITDATDERILNLVQRERQ